MFRAGDVLRDKYRVKRVLGEGGMGVVLRATNIRLNQDVAIKVLCGKGADGPSTALRFAREARVAARLRGEHVVRILDVDDGEPPFLVMELLDGRDLERLVRERGPLPVRDAVGYVLQACEGLAEAHAIGVVHRDVKPANLFLARTPGGGEVVKLLDFGISKAPVTWGGDPTLTHGDRVLGSPSFMSPEQTKAAHDVDTRTDVWALGTVLFFLLTDRLPFPGESAMEVAARIASEPPLSLSALRSDVPPALEDIVMRCLAKDRDERWPSVASLARALAPFTPAGAEAAARVSTMLRVPAAEPSSNGSPPLARTSVGRMTATLPPHAPIAADAPAERLTASLDAPGPVSLGLDRAGGAQPEEGAARTRRAMLLPAIAAAALLASLALAWVATRPTGSAPPAPTHEARAPRTDEARPAPPTPSARAEEPADLASDSARAHGEDAGPAPVPVLSTASAPPRGPARHPRVPRVTTPARAAPQAAPSVARDPATTTAPTGEPLELELK